MLLQHIESLEHRTSAALAYFSLEGWRTADVPTMHLKWSREWDSNSHVFMGQRILSPPSLPVPSSRVEIGPSGGIWTPDNLLPKQTDYQAVQHSVLKLNSLKSLKFAGMCWNRTNLVTHNSGPPRQWPTSVVAGPLCFAARPSLRQGFHQWNWKVVLKGNLSYSRRQLVNYSKWRFIL